MSLPRQFIPAGVGVEVQGRASKNRLLGRHGQRRKTALTAPPVDGAANAMLGPLSGRVARQRPQSAVSLRFGAKRRTKQPLIQTSVPTRIGRRRYALLGQT